MLRRTLVLLVLGAAVGYPPSVHGAPSTIPSSQVGLGDTLVRAISVATRSGRYHAPLDSTPDASGQTIYFTAQGPHGPGVFRVPAAGGRVTEVVAGAPLVRPRGIAISPDGQILYIADPGAGPRGRIFLLPVGGGTLSPLRGSAGTRPQNMDVVRQGGQQRLYFTGHTPRTGKPAVLLLPVRGAPTPTVVVAGSPLVAPDGIAVAPSGAIYVADRATEGPGSGSIVTISGRRMTSIVTQVHLGNPAGIALSPDDSLLLVSAHQRTSVRDRVLVVNVRTFQTGSITKVVGANHSAGGLHRSPGNRHIYSWADVAAGGRGRVYVVNV